MNLKQNLKLYCTYHDKSLEMTYVNTKPWVNPCYRPLVENEWFKPYYTKEGHYNSLDNLQSLFCEFTALYYVYKNNLYSPYIGLCHYGRQHLRHLVDTDTLPKAEGKNYVENIIGDVYNYNGFGYIVNDWFQGFLYDDIKEFIETNYSNQSVFYKVFITDYYEVKPWISNMNFIAKWEYVYQVIKFVSDFIDWHNKKHNLNSDETKYREYIKTEFIDKTDWSKIDKDWLIGNEYRVMAYYCEFMLGFLLAELHNNPDIIYE